MAEERTITALVGLVTVAIQVGLAAVLTALTVWTWRGSSIARIALIAAAGFMTACATAVATIPARSTKSLNPSPLLAQVDQLMASTQPGWETIVDLPARAATIGFPVVAVALLLTPASSRFFRQQRNVTVR